MLMNLEGADEELEDYVNEKQPKLEENKV